MNHTLMKRLLFREASKMISFLFRADFIKHQTSRIQDILKSKMGQGDVYPDPLVRLQCFLFALYPTQARKVSNNM